MDTATIPLIDTDTHVTEPPDLWTSRMPQKFADLAPRPVWVESAGEEMWKVGDVFIEGVGAHAVAGWREYPPSYPPSLESADAAAFDPKVRLQRMDEYGITAQVLYPNIIAFETLEFLKVGPDFALAAVRAWNDFLAEFAEADPARLVPIMALPFWDVEESIRELHRAIGLGHKGVLLAAHFDKAGLPNLWEDRWTPLLREIEEAGLSINLHIGFHQFMVEDHQKIAVLSTAKRAREVSLQFMGNARQVADVVTTGLCHRFPKLNFVSVESGASWLPFIMESLDWHWKNYGCREEFPDMELPSHYIKRQVYGTFWFESEAIKATLPLLPDNMMFETDFPHSTSLSPGPRSTAEQPRKMVTDALSGLPDELVRKAFFETAARLYQLDVSDGEPNALSEAGGHPHAGSTGMAEGDGG